MPANAKADVILSAHGRVEATLMSGVLTVTKRSFSGGDSGGDTVETVFEVPAASTEEATDILRSKGAMGNFFWASWNPANLADGQPSDPSDPRRAETTGDTGGAGDGGEGSGSGE